MKECISHFIDNKLKIKFCLMLNWQNFGEGDEYFSKITKKTFHADD